MIIAAKSLVKVVAKEVATGAVVAVVEYDSVISPPVKHHFAGGLLVLFGSSLLP